MTGLSSKILTICDAWWMSKYTVMPQVMKIVLYAENAGGTGREQGII